MAWTPFGVGLDVPPGTRLPGTTPEVVLSSFGDPTNPPEPDTPSFLFVVFATSYLSFLNRGGRIKGGRKLLTNFSLEIVTEHLP